MVIAKDNTIHNVEIHNGVTYNNSILPRVIVAYYYTNSSNERIHLYNNDSSISNAVYNGTVTGDYYTFPSSGSHEVVINLKSTTFNPSIFKNITYVRTITIGKNITNITRKTYTYGNDDRYWFTQTTVEAGNPVYHRSTIDSSVTVLGRYAFAHAMNSDKYSPGTSTYWSITIPNTVREIEDYCFDDVQKINRIDLYGRPTLSEHSLKMFLGTINTSTLHIKQGTSIANTYWKTVLIDDRRWLFCADL